MFARLVAKRSAAALLAPAGIVSRRIAPAVVIATRPFSIASRVYSAGQVDADLVKSLNKELEYEREQMSDKEFKAFPAFVEEFKKTSQFDVIDKAGSKEVHLAKKFGNEKITVIFSTDALTEAEEMVEQETEDGAEEAASYPVNLTVLISKPDVGVVELAVTLEGDSFFIDNVNYGKDNAVMSEETAEADWQRRGMYSGPVFSELDEALQDRFHEYLEERGFNEELSNFIPEYIEYKEQNEYVNWLNNVTKFISN